MSTTTWNQEQEVLIASAELGDSTGRDAVALLVAARKRAFDAEQHIRQLAPAKPWDDAREFQRLAGEVAAIDRKAPLAFIRELHHMILSARKVAFWADERAYALKLELEAAPKEVPPKWIKVTDRLPHVGQLVVGRAQLGKNRARRILLTYYPDPKAPNDPPWMADDFALYSLTKVPLWAPIPSEEA